ncbi:MAG: FixH family protein [Rhodovarius sp.]|nr:FixH family protein [Rhodovarius sp.]
MTMRSPSRDVDPSRSRWIPWAFVGAMLLVVAVNGVMVWLALSTFTGVTTPRAYDRGRAYNEVLAEAARQDALGWRSSVRLEAGRLVVEVEDAEGRPVQGLLAGALHRPLSLEVVALEWRPLAPGRWAAAVADLPPGQWEARLSLTGREGRLDIRRRVIAP